MNINKKIIYLDNAATTRPHRTVLFDIERAMQIFWMNPSSPYEGGREVRRVIEESRAQIAKFINAEPEEVYFCSSGTEANNLVIQGLANYIHKKDVRSVLLRSDMEHPSVRNIKCCSCTSKLDNKINKSSIASVMMANNEIGCINDIKSLAEIVHEYGGVFHTDATAYAPHRKIDVKDLNVDALTFSGHKLGLPRGIAVMYIKKGTNYEPVLYGGGQESGVRPGTENQALIYALGEAVSRIDFEKQHEAEIKLRDAFMEVIERARDIITINNKHIKDIVYNSYQDDENTDCLDTLFSIQFRGISSSILMNLLADENVYCSAGSACSSGSESASRTLLALGLSEEEARSTLRFSLDAYENSVEDIKEFGTRLNKCIGTINYFIN